MMESHKELDCLKNLILDYIQRNIKTHKKRQEINHKIEELFNKIKSTLEGKPSDFEAEVRKHRKGMRETPGVKVRGLSLTKIEGIGVMFAQKLQEIGVTSTQKLLSFGASRQGRKKLADEVGISQQKVLDWVNLADLMRIKGVGEEYTDLLEETGVDTVPELAQRNPANLHQKIIEINEQKMLVRRVPSEAEVEVWVAQAKKLPRVINY